MTNSPEFLMAYYQTMENEGIRSNHPLDPGGITFMGMSKVYWPESPVWDMLKDSEGKVTPEIVEEVKSFYRVNFWNRILGDELTKISLDIAMEVFDTAVNLGVSKASKILQRALNLLNRNQKRFGDLMVDGKIGSKTVRTLSIYCEQRPPSKENAIKVLLKVVNSLQAMHYIELMEAYPEKEEFIGWFNRV